MKTIFLILFLSLNIFAQNSLMILMSSDPTTTPAILSDGNTVGWYDMATVTKNANNKVTSWTDLSGNNNHFIQADTSKSPTLTATAVEFDGVNDYMIASDSTFQPLTYYLVTNLNNWSLGGYIIDGLDINMGVFVYATSPEIRLYGGVSGAANIDLTLDEYSIITAVFNAASSSLQVDDSTATTGSIGTNNAGGMTLATKQNLAVFEKVDFKEIIIRKGADDALNQALVKSYLNNKYSVY